MVEIAIYPATGSDTDTIVQNNNVYSTDTGLCWRTSQPITLINNTCTTEYAGAIPTSWTDAGLSNPSIIGVQ